MRFFRPAALRGLGQPRGSFTSTAWPAAIAQSVAGTPPPVAPGNFTLLAGVGAFIFSGEVMSPVVDYKLPANAGAFVETGVAAGLIAARTMPGAAGAFALTGIAAGLTYTPVASGSAWGDHGTHTDLSMTTIANDTATGGAGNSGAWTTVRGAQARSAGLHVFELYMISAPTVANFIVGLIDNATANGAAMDGNLLTNSGGHTQFNGSSQSNGYTGNNLGVGFPLADGDTLVIATDHTNEFWYLASDHTGSLVWFLSGDPTSGALGTGAAGTAAMTGARPMLALFGVGNGIVKLKTTGLKYALPALYSEWG